MLLRNPVKLCRAHSISRSKNDQEDGFEEGYVAMKYAPSKDWSAINADSINSHILASHIVGTNGNRYSDGRAIE